MRYTHRNFYLRLYDTTVSEYLRKHNLKSRTKHEISISASYIIEQANTYLEKDFNNMAKKKSNGNSNFGFTTKFAVISLDSEGKELAKQWLTTNSKDLDTFFGDMVRDGWKTSVRWDDDNDCFIASATQVDDDDKNHNVCVTSRSDNMYESILINYYKIYILFDNRRLPVEAAKANWG